MIGFTEIVSLTLTDEDVDAASSKAIILSSYTSTDHDREVLVEIRLSYETIAKLYHAAKKLGKVNQ